MLSTPLASSVSASASTAVSSSASRTPPLASTRSGTVKRSVRGTSGSGFSMKMSYCSKRFSCAISMESRKPLVVTSAVLAPLRSMMALVASVVPCTIRPTWEGAMPADFSARSMPSSTPSSGAALVVSTLAREALIGRLQHHVGEGAADIDGETY